MLRPVSAMPPISSPSLTCCEYNIEHNSFPLVPAAYPLYAPRSATLPQDDRLYELSTYSRVIGLFSVGTCCGCPSTSARANFHSGTGAVPQRRSQLSSRGGLCRRRSSAVCPRRLLFQRPLRHTRLRSGPRLVPQIRRTAFCSRSGSARPHVSTSSGSAAE